MGGCTHAHTNAHARPKGDRARGRGIQMGLNRGAAGLGVAAFSWSLTRGRAWAGAHARTHASACHMYASGKGSRMRIPTRICRTLGLPSRDWSGQSDFRAGLVALLEGRALPHSPTLLDSGTRRCSSQVQRTECSQGGIARLKSWFVRLPRVAPTLFLVK